jgi:hypothetical protein
MSTKDGVNIKAKRKVWNIKNYYGGIAQHLYSLKPTLTNGDTRIDFRTLVY